MTKRHNIYTLGAAHGLVIGAMLSMAFLLQGLGGANLWLTILGDVFLVAAPFVLYRQIVRDHDNIAFSWTFSALWLEGIVTCLCGALILALVTYVFCRFLHPGWFAETLGNVVTAYREVGVPEATQMADELETLFKQGGMPTPIQMAFAMLWSTAFMGSMISLVVSFVIRYITRRKR